MQESTIEEILMNFDEEEIEYLKQTVKDHNATHIVLAENNNMSSSAFGQKTVMVVGGTSSYRLEECEGKWLNDLPSQRQYFTKYASTDGWIEDFNRDAFNDEMSGLIEQFMADNKISEEQFCELQKAIERKYNIFDYKKPSKRD